MGSTPANRAPLQRHNQDGRRALSVWLAAVSVYVLALFHRSSLGVAGIMAADRFHVSSSTLATFSIVQVAVYAVMQLPVGALLDRYGSKRMLMVGLTLVTAAQLAFAQVDSLAAVIVCRVLLGLGDAMVFISVLRLVALWFTPRRAPLFTQLTAMCGGLGAIAAAGPLTIALHEFGWSTSFTGAALVGVLSGALLVIFVKDSPFETPRQDELRLSAVARTLRLAWQVPATRLGLWTHFTAQFSQNVFTLLWGYPFLVAGQGLTPGAASLLLMSVTATAMCTGPIVGLLTMRYPFQRSTMVMVIALCIIAMWTCVLLWPGRAPVPLLLALCITMAVGGPGSMIGFDLARSFNPPTHYGSASGIVNTGGFVATLLAVGGIGLVLDRLAPQGPSGWDLDAFRWAMTVQYPVWLFGLVQVFRYRRKTRRYALQTDPEAFHASRRGEQATFY